MGKLKYILLLVLILGLVASLLYSLNDKKDTSGIVFSGPINEDWTPVYIDTEIGTLMDVTSSYAELVEYVSPSVVSIITEKVDYDLFRQPYPTRGAGTGVIIDPRGYIVTNYHVIEEAEKVTVILSDGEKAEATKWIGDSDADLAVVVINKDDLPYAKFLQDSSDNLKIGDKVMAIGNAGGRGIASTEGTVSYLGEAIQIDDEILYDLIRTSAAINPGNSGGPLVNLAGQVVGINVAINPDYENFGYSISTNTAIPIIERLVKKGNEPVAWLGVIITDVDNVTPEFETQYNISVDSGAVVAEVVSDGPADKAGIRKGDVIISINDVAVTSASDLVEIIQSHEPGEVVGITYMRGSEEKKVEATLVQKP